MSSAQRFVTVSIPRTPLKNLSYTVPDNLPDIVPGMRVLVPVGPRFVTAFAVNNDPPGEGQDLKPVADLLDQECFFSPEMIRLTQWIADYYLAEWADVLKSALPPGLDVRPDTVITITAKGEFESQSHPILQALQEKKRLSLKKIYELFGHRGTFSQIRSLQEQSLLDVVAEKQAARRGYNMVEVVEASEPPPGEKERAVYEYIRSQPAAVWMQDVRERFKTAAALVRKMSERGQLRCFWVPAAPKSLWPALEPVNRMNAGQQEAFDRVRATLGSFAVHLLHGVTGSGKTEVYLRLADEVLAAGKTVLILVPEIALLPLIAHRSEQTLGRKLSILHSELTERERLEEWQKARRGDVRLVIGTRSAVFAPLRNLGLIVMDEEHDSSYKQKEYPRYHARESAIMRASYEGCPIVLGSATPSVEAFYNGGNGKFHYLQLPVRVEDRPMPEVRLIDMKSEYKQTGDPMFSRFLLEQVEARLAKREQVLLLQNRRGFASLLMCRECGNVLECPNCSVTLTYHKLPNRMRCHYCDYSRLAPSRCEKCQSAFLHLFGVGTEKVGEALKLRFPDARIERFDRDTTRTRGSIARILTRFAMKEIDILVGTQMLAKGHDFPNVTLVGIVSADTAIGIPDFRSSERLFQLITQVAGRSGRGAEPGQVVLQTFHPDHYAIRCAMEHSYPCFYEKEIRFRRLMQYPPYVSLANIIFAGKDARKTVEEAREFAKLVLAMKTETMKSLGPAMAAMARIAGLHRFQILVKSPSRKDLHACLRGAMEHYEKGGKRHSQYSVDVDPFSIV
ncbi:MAG TPA: primosomal protein N' [Acidobacteriota bacterium]|nr:primosomal protein N' [Acidobacteriota bacterium]